MAGFDCVCSDYFPACRILLALELAYYNDGLHPIDARDIETQDCSIRWQSQTYEGNTVRKPPLHAELSSVHQR